MSRTKDQIIKRIAELKGYIRASRVALEEALADGNNRAAARARTNIGYNEANIRELGRQLEEAV